MFIKTALPESAQDGRPTRDQARQRSIYAQTPVFIIATVKGQDAGMETRFSRVVDIPAGPDGLGQRQHLSRPHPPTLLSLPAVGVQSTAVNHEPRKSTEDGNGRIGVPRRPKPGLSLSRPNIGGRRLKRPPNLWCSIRPCLGLSLGLRTHPRPGLF